jgi:hypothetical protein
MVPLPGHWDGGGWLIRPFRGVATFAGLAHARRVRSRTRLGRALRSGRLNQPQLRFVAEEAGSAEAGVALAAVGIEDPERGSPARWAGPIAGDDHLCSLPDDVPAEPDPRSAGQLQPDAGRLADGGSETSARGRPRRLEHDERDSGPARERGHSGEAIREPGGAW